MSFFCNENILRLQVSVQNSMGMAIVDSAHDLVDDALDLHWRDLLLDLSQIFLQVKFDIFENEIEGSMSVNHLDQPKILVISKTYSTILGCFSPLSKEISLIAVEGTPSTSFSSLIFLRATTYKSGLEFSFSKLPQFRLYTTLGSRLVKLQSLRALPL